MNKTYRELFTAIARALEINAERVMEVNKEKGDEKGLTAATTLRQDYATLYDNLKNEAYVPTKADYARLLIGCSIVVTQLVGKIKREQDIVNAYKTDTMPKLNQIVAAESEEAAQELVNKLFTINEKSEN